MADGFLRLFQIVNCPRRGTTGLLSISRSFFLDGVKKGRFPKPVKLSARVSVWRRSEIEDLIRHQPFGKNNAADGQDS
jgi:prophage regulatory protein